VGLFCGYGSRVSPFLALQMERCFSVEAKRFSFSEKVEVPELRL
jgi:hypothetical protein